MKKGYKVEIIKEGALGTLIFGSRKLPLKKMAEVMNKYGEEGWDVSFQLIEKHRLLLFWSREAVIITFSRNKQQIKIKVVLAYLFLTLKIISDPSHTPR